MAVARVTQVIGASPHSWEDAVRNALDKRSDVRGAKNSLEQSDINIKYYNNQVKPDVNAQVTYGAIGIGGTQQSGGFNPFTGQTTPLTSVVRSYGSALGDVFSNAYPQWTVGLQVGYPLGANTAHANLARVKLEYDQAQTQLKNMQMQVTTQVRQVARDVQTNQQRVQTTRASREFTQRRLEAEQRKFEAGTSTNFLVFQAQRDLSVSQNNELRAILDYIQSKIDLETVQEVPLR